MKNFKALAFASLLAVTGVFGVANKAQAGCYPALAADDIANMLRGGASTDQAIDWAIRNGNLDSEGCLVSTVGYMRSMHFVFGDVVR